MLKYQVYRVSEFPMQALRFTKSKIKFDNFLYTEEKDVANKMVL